MMTLIFSILMLVVFGKLVIWAIKAAWSIGKVLFTIIFLPVILIAMACAGFIGVAIVLLIIGGIVAFVAAAVA